MLVASHVSSRQVNDEATPLIPGQWKSPRIEVLDILRGFIMVIMAVDHIGCCISMWKAHSQLIYRTRAWC